MKIYHFGTAPKAKAAGYEMIGAIHSTVEALTAGHASEDVIFVYGARCARSARRVRVRTVRAAGETPHRHPPWPGLDPNGETQLAVALEDLQHRIAEGQEYPDAEWAAACKHGVDCTSLRAAYDAADEA